MPLLFAASDSVQTMVLCVYDSEHLKAFGFTHTTVRDGDSKRDEVTSHGKRRRRRTQNMPWPRSASACGTPTGPAPSASTCPQHVTQTSQRLRRDLTHPSHRIIVLVRSSTNRPGRVGGRYEEVDGHSVTHVEKLLHFPAKDNEKEGLQKKKLYIYIYILIDGWCQWPRWN